MKASPQADFSKPVISQPKYSHIKLNPLESAGQTVTIGSSGGTTVTFDIPVGCINFSRSFLSFTITPTAGGNAKYNWLFTGHMPIRDIQLSTNRNLLLCDIQNANYYTNEVLMATTRKDEFDSYPSFDASVLSKSVGNLLYRSNALGTAAAAIRPNNFPASVSYEERNYVQVGGSNTATPVYYARIPLSMIKHSILSLDKDLYFGENLKLKLVFPPRDTFGFISADAADPTSSAAALAGDISLTTMQLWVANEQNPEIINAIEGQYRAGGYTVMTDFVTSMPNPLSGTSQNVTIRINSGFGKRLKRIYHSAYLTAESANVRFSRDALSDAKIKEFHTELDYHRLQNDNMDTSNYDDWVIISKKLKDSLVYDANIYYYNWFWCDNFDGCESLTDQPEDSQDICGLDLVERERIWQLISTTASVGLTHHTFVVAQREMVITPSGISFAMN